MKIKIHPPILKGIQQTLRDVFEGGYYADKVLERCFKANRKWGRRDRRAVAESVYEVVRNWRALQLLAEGEKKNLKGQDPHLSLVYVWLEAFQEDFEWEANPLTGRRAQILKAYESLAPKEKYSYPDWIDELMVKQRGEKEWSELREPLNSQAPVFLRANLLKGDASRVQEILAQEDFHLEVFGKEALMLNLRRNVFSSRAFQDGLFEVQDLHSQKVVDILDPQPGETVVDACAGAGGKTLHISSRMNNKGKVIGLDVSQAKLEQLKKRARRAGVHNLEIKAIDSTKVIKRLKGRADRLLLDVPCSGLGVLRRNPDTKWKLTPARVHELEKIQEQILNDYTQMLKPGGVLVYSTCSLLPSENKEQIQRFLSKNQSFILESEIELFPGPRKGDGFYIARLKHRGAL